MEFNYLVERARMLNSLGRKGGKCSGVPCEVCPLYRSREDDLTIPFDFVKKCENFESEHPIEATEIVRKWAKEHPRKTRRNVLLEKFPKAILDKNGQPCVCAQMLGLRDYDNICEDKEECLQCWNTEVEE